MKLKDWGSGFRFILMAVIMIVVIINMIYTQMKGTTQFVDYLLVVAAIFSFAIVSYNYYKEKRNHKDLM